MKLSELIAGMQLEEAQARGLFSKHLELALTVGPSASRHHCEILTTLLMHHYWRWMDGYLIKVPHSEWPEGWGLVLEALARHPKTQGETAFYIISLAHLELTTQFYETEMATQRIAIGISPDSIKAQFKPVFSREQRNRAANAILSYCLKSKVQYPLPRPNDSVHYRAPMYRAWVEWINHLEPDQKERWDDTYSACVNGLGQITDPEA